MATTSSTTATLPSSSPPSPTTITHSTQLSRHGTCWPPTPSAAVGSSSCSKRSPRLQLTSGWNRVLVLMVLLGSLGHIVRGSAAAPKVFQMSSQREDTPDFFNDYWSPDENNGYLKGEVERLMREHPENTQFVQSLDSQYFQIIYPLQVPRHGKSGQGISTRDASKITSNHVHRTSYRIKAFSHVFTVDLELNTQLLGPSVKALHQTRSGRQQADQRIEHCYYHGTVKDYTGAIAAFRTCDGLAGIIQLGNETLIVSPMTGGGSLSKHPHFVTESKNLHINQKCGVTKNFDDWSGGPRYSSTGSRGRRRKQTHHRYTRNANVRQSTKYIETALFLDKRFMEIRNNSTSRAVNDALQIANIADLYFKTINTRLTVTYLETWAYQNPIQLGTVGRQVRLSSAIIHFYEHVQKTVREPKDTAQLISGERFTGGESGFGVPNSICSEKAAGISVDLNVYEPHLVASTLTHMIGHNLHMQHDDGRPNCFCQDWHGCIMSQTVVGQDNVQPSKFSKCSTEDYIRAISNADEGRGSCLLQPSQNRPRPNIPYPPIRGTPPTNTGNWKYNGPRCGDGKVDAGEQCDCGPAYKCDIVDPCCQKNTCKLKLDAECATGPCCKDCKVQAKNVQCRKAESECDIPEFCDGTHGNCPMNTYKKNGNKCGSGQGYCYNGVCPTLDNQCSVIWGYGGQASDKMCYQQFNKEGVQYGNCGKSKNGSYIKCEAGDIMCGTLQCQMGMQHPISPSMDQSYSRTIVAMAGQEYECKTVRYENRPERSNEPDWTLVNDGTACGENLVCYNHTCTSIYPFIEQGKCSSNNKALECSGHGVCSNVNTCYCNPGWIGDDCSTYDSSVSHRPTSTDWPPLMTGLNTPGPKTTTSKSWNETQGKNTQYVGQQGSDTVFLVIVLVSGMGSVFFAFAFMALCYRRKSTMPKYDPPYMKRPIVKKPPQQHMQPMGISKTEETSLQGVDMGSRIITFGNLPSYSPGRPPLSPSLARSRSLDSCREHKLNPMKRSGPPGVGSQSEEEALQSGEDEAVSFIELPPNNLSKIPEKGILKKSYGLTPAEKEKWSEESQSDNNDVLSQSDNNADPECQVSEVERTLKSLNGYHEDIIDALKRAASHRSGTTSMSSDEIHTVHHDTFPRYPAGAAGLGGPGEFTRLKMSHENLKMHHGDSGGEDDQVAPCGPIRIRNLEDLIRQLEHHPSRHMSPSGSEEIRMSETEADRHYRLDSSSCTESQGGRGGADNGGVGFVYGRYRQPPSSGTSGASGATGSQRGSDRLGCDYSDGQDSHAYTEEDDLERHDAGETADSESDEFVVLPKGIRGHAGQYFWPVGK